MRAEVQLARAATVALVAVAVVRCTVAFAPDIRFDTDPAINPIPFAGLGPTGSLLLDAIALLASATALAAERRAGRRVHLTWVLAAGLPGIAVFLHGWGNAMDLFRGSTWLAAAFGCVAAMHLARDAANRRLLVAGLSGVFGILVLRGLEQVWIEHAATVREFEKSKLAFFAQYGWDPQGSAARAYERRLRQPEATGWFTLANLFSAMMAFGTLFFGGTVVGGLIRERREASERDPGEGRAVVIVLSALVALGCGTLLVVNGSKGAIGVTALGAVLIAIGHTRWRGAVPALSIAIVLLVAAGPTLRGLLPESFAGEKSLLFRAQYLEGALRAMPEAMPLGLGPDGFQDAYVRLKPERSPEDVMSAHAMLIDWLVLLGPLALAWVAIVARGVWRAPGAPVREADASGPVAMALVALSVLAAGLVAEAPLLDEWWLITHGAGAIAFLLTSFAVARAFDSAAWRGALGAAFAGATVAVVAQGQIEMLFFQPGMVVWLLLALGVAAPLPPSDAIAPSAKLSLAMLLPIAAASLVIAFGLVPQFALDRRMDDAAELLRPIAELRERRNDLAKEIGGGRAGEATARALRLFGLGVDPDLSREATETLAKQAPPTDRFREFGALIERFESGQRIAAAELLLAAREVAPTNWRAERAAIDQLVAASRRNGVVDSSARTFEQAMHLADASFVHWRTPRFAAVRAELRFELARATRDESALAAALAAALSAAEDAMALEPLSPSRRIAVGDLLAVQGKLAEAVASWRRALELDQQRELDPITQMSAKERAAIEERIARASAPAPPPPRWPLLGG